jgi:hypothetical protein
VLVQHYQNAPADECALLLVDRGERIVKYRRAIYAIIGLYFARVQNHSGHRELFFILRTLNGDGGQQIRNVLAGLVSSNGADPPEEDR